MAGDPYRRLVLQRTGHYCVNFKEDEFQGRKDLREAGAAHALNPGFSVVNPEGFSIKKNKKHN